MILSVDKIAVYYGKIRAIHDLTLQLDKGELVALIGANGAGKTTTLRAISGLESFTQGDIVFKGQSLKSLSPSDITAKGIGHSPEGRRVFTRLSVLENLELGAFLRKDKSQVKMDLSKMFEYFPILFERRKQRAGTLSGGEQQMLAIARALMGRPELLLLDEPSMGLAPLIVQQIMDIIFQVSQEGNTILLVEQNAQQALKIAKRAYVLENGTIKLQGEASHLLKDPRVTQAYFGS